jgi:hypothetical protein
MLDVHFVILGVAIGGLGQVAYARDALRGRTQPNRVTWLLWAVAPLLAFTAEVDAGVGLRALLTFAAGFGPLMILTATLISGRSAWRIAPLDIACGTLSIVGLVGWLATRQGLVAITASIAADGLAWVPTMVKSWQDPGSESVAVYAGAFVNASITLLTVTRVTAAVVGFPAYVLVVAAIQLVLVAGRAGPRFRARAGQAARSGG